jgi:glucose/arabinose dehydrogenase
MQASLAFLLFAAALPGFLVHRVGATAGFADSIVFDSRGTIYYTTTAGKVFRFVDGDSKLIAQVNTVAIGNSGLLGMALRDDSTAIVHYTTPRQTADVISTIDLTTGTETVLHSFVCDKDLPQRGSPPEHHGGNPIVAADGSIFVGIGDYGGGAIAALPDWNGGKIFRLFPDGSIVQFARGFRNPFDLSWDEPRQRLIVPDNGDLADDEINIVHLGDYCGWPYTMGNGPTIEGAVAPIYVFPVIVAPTGLVTLDGRNSMLRQGYLLGGFVTKAIYYIPDIDVRPLPDPMVIIRGETGAIVDLALSPNGDIFFVTGTAIYRLVVPLRGDCNGDGRVDAADIAALAQELLDGNPHPTIRAQEGSFPGSWGCDVNGDGLIDSRDMSALLSLLAGRLRAVQH